jgi:hypothetical protein
LHRGGSLKSRSILQLYYWGIEKNLLDNIKGSKIWTEGNKGKT